MESIAAVLVYAGSLVSRSKEKCGHSAFMVSIAKFYSASGSSIQRRLHTVGPTRLTRPLKTFRTMCMLSLYLTFELFSPLKCLV